MEAFGVVSHRFQSLQGCLGVLVDEYPCTRQCGNRRQFRPATALAAVGADKLFERLQQFHGLIALALDQTHADLFAQQLGHRSNLSQAA
ncbi:hypothetical protein D3C75_852610 [compost metagenome]